MFAHDLIVLPFHKFYEYDVNNPMLTLTYRIIISKYYYYINNTTPDIL
ncbi:hypothetical protein FM106_31885 [Brachybacterium faecium]|nr:hypothetical protein FM106_31885 [Brachybacterium faecium]